MEKDLSKDKRFVTMTPKDFAMGEVNFGGDKVASGKAVPLDTKVQKALFVVDDIRSKTVNTLKALSTLTKEDSLKLRVIEQKLNDLKNISDKILDESGSSGEGEANAYLNTLGQVKDLLKEYKGTKIQGMDFEAFLKKQQLETSRRMLIEKEVVKVLNEASKNLGVPFSTFLKENIKSISNTPIRREASNPLMSLAGPVAPILAMMRDFVPQVIDEFDRIKATYKGIKAKFTGEDKEKEAAEVIANKVDVDSEVKRVDPLSKEDSSNIKATAISAKSIVKALKGQESSKEDEELKDSEFQEKVLGNLKVLKENSEDDEKNKEKKGGGLLSSIAGFLGGGLLKTLFKGGLIGAIGSGLMKLLGPLGGMISKGVSGAFNALGPKLLELGGMLAKGLSAVIMNPATWVVAGVAISGAIANYVGGQLGKYFGEKKEQEQAGFEKLAHPEGFQLSPEKEEKLFGKQITPTDKKEVPVVPEWQKNKDFSKELSKDPIPKLDIKPSEIKPNKIIPKETKEFDVNALIKGLTESITKATQGQKSNYMNTSKKSSEDLPILAKDFGLALINQGHF